MGMARPTNPFHYGTPVGGAQFTGRTAELDALAARLRDGINVVLISPRRYGKTSLHQAATARLQRSRPAPAVVEVNVLRAGTLARFVSLLTAGAYRLPGTRWARARQAVPEFLRRVRVTPTVTFDAGGNPRFGFDAAIGGADAETVIADVYTLLGEAAATRPSVLVLDEFQAVTRLGADLPDLLKALADEHPSVSLVLAGSRRHLMDELVVERRAPLFGMAQHLAIGPIDDAAMVRFLVDRAATGGRTMTEATAALLLARAGPVPNDIQHLAYDAFELAGAVVDDAAVDAGMAAAVGHDAALYAEQLTRLSPGQTRLVVALASRSPDQPYSAGFARSVGLANASSVHKALQPLLETDDVVLRDGRLVVADPFFAEWLRGDPT